MSTVLKSPISGAVVDTCAKYQREFNNCNKFKEEKKLIFSIIKNPEFTWENTTPAPVVFEWKTDLMESILEISEDINFENTEKYVVAENTFSLYNLKKDTEYFWRVNGSEPEKIFTDNIMPRWLKVDGVGNVRDIGGRKNINDKRIKQGLIFRGSKLENDLTETGTEQLKNLGIKTELDLRKEAIGTVNHSFIGEDVEYIQIPCSAYDEFIENDIKNGTCKKLIELLADSEKYPIYFHCYGGADRTGTLAFLLDAILNLDDETMLKEYENTMLASPSQKISRSRKGKFKPFIKYIKKNGNKKSSLKDNTITFLLNAGVSQNTMNKICNNLLEK